MLRGGHELRMLRRNPQSEILAAVFFEAGWRRDGGIERDARILAARDGGDPKRRKKAARRSISTWRGGWLEYRRAVWRAKLLPDAAFDCDSTAGKKFNRRRDRPRRIFWIASEPRAPGAALPQKP